MRADVFYVFADLWQDPMHRGWLDLKPIGGAGGNMSRFLKRHTLDGLLLFPLLSYLFVLTGLPYCRVW
jgi:hypothetical protein